jgi:hypothetical protein
MLRRVASSLAVALTLARPSATEAGLDTQQLTLIKETAASICNTVKNVKGEKTDVQIRSEVKGKLSGLLGRLVGDTGALNGATGALNKEEFEGLNQDAVADAVAGDRECREKLFDKMIDALTSPQKEAEPKQK